MIWRPSDNCEIVLFERDWCRGPYAWEFGVYWNRRDLIEGTALREGDMIYMDELVLRWRWKPGTKTTPHQDTTVDSVG